MKNPIQITFSELVKIMEVLDLIKMDYLPDLGNYIYHNNAQPEKSNRELNKVFVENGKIIFYIDSPTDEFREFFEKISQNKAILANRINQRVMIREENIYAFGWY